MDQKADNSGCKASWLVFLVYLSVDSTTAIVSRRSGKGTGRCEGLWQPGTEASDSEVNNEGHVGDES